MKRIIETMLQMEPGALSQIAIWIPDIRKSSGIPHDEFDRLMFQAEKSGILYFDRHCHPGIATKRQRAEFLIRGDDVFITATFRKNVAEKIAALGDPVDRVSVDQGPKNKTDQPGRNPVKRISLAKRESVETLPKPKGGKRPGSGRKAGKTIVPEHLRRVQIRGAVRIPAWLHDWLKSRGMAGELITQALIHHYDLTPPA